MADSLSPLVGKRVVVTRAPEQARELIVELEALGAEVLALPTVSFAPPEDWAPPDEALRALGRFDWVILTSQNAVRYFCQRCGELGVPLAGKAGKPQYAAVGPATARAAEDNGLRVIHTATGFRGADLAREMAQELTGKCVLLPRSDRARPDLPAALRAAGADVVDVIAYRTLSPAPADGRVMKRVREGAVDVLTFASPSAFHHLSEELGTERLRELAQSVAFAAIGPVTAHTIREVGLPVAIESAESTAGGLVKAMVGYFEKQGAGVK